MLRAGLNTNSDHAAASSDCSDDTAGHNIVAIMTIATPLLDAIKCPADLRRLEEKDLRQLADELRAETVSAVAVTGGHLGAGLGVVELTVALHHVFGNSMDRVVRDVGPQ